MQTIDQSTLRSIWILQGGRGITHDSIKIIYRKATIPHQRKFFQHHWTFTHADSEANLLQRTRRGHLENVWFRGVGLVPQSASLSGSWPGTHMGVRTSLESNQPIDSGVSQPKCTPTRTHNLLAVTAWTECFQKNSANNWSFKLGVSNRTTHKSLHKATPWMRHELRPSIVFKGYSRNCNNFPHHHAHVSFLLNYVNSQFCPKFLNSPLTFPDQFFILPDLSRI